MLLLKRSPMHSCQTHWPILYDLLQESFKTSDKTGLLTAHPFLGFGDTKSSQFASCLSGFWLTLTDTLLFLCYAPATLASFSFWNMPSLFPSSPALLHRLFPMLGATWRFSHDSAKYHDLIVSLLSFFNVTHLPHSPFYFISHVFLS